MFRLPQVVNLFWLMWYRAIVDARLAFTILQGFTITFGFANQDELKGWITMKLTNSDRLKEKVASMTTFDNFWSRHLYLLHKQWVNTKALMSKG
jgi:hypothetical protein